MWRARHLPPGPDLSRQGGLAPGLSFGRPADWQTDKAVPSRAQRRSRLGPGWSGARQPDHSPQGSRSQTLPSDVTTAPPARGCGRSRPPMRLGPLPPTSPVPRGPSHPQVPTGWARQLCRRGPIGVLAAPVVDLRCWPRISRPGPEERGALGAGSWGDGVGQLSCPAAGSWRFGTRTPGQLARSGVADPAARGSDTTWDRSHGRENTTTADGITVSEEPNQVTGSPLEFVKALRREVPATATPRRNSTPLTSCERQHMLPRGRSHAARGGGPAAGVEWAFELSFSVELRHRFRLVACGKSQPALAPRRHIHPIRSEAPSADCPEAVRGTYRHRAGGMSVARGLATEQGGS